MRKLFLLLLTTAATAMGLRAVTIENTAGQLSQLVTDTQLTELTVTGEMDARDFLFITEQLTQLTAIDLSGATVVGRDNGTTLYGTVTSYAADEIPRTAFFGKKLTTVALPAGLKSIGFAAFAGCYQLQNVTLPATLTYIDDYAFAGSALTAVEIPATVQGMGKGVFARCEQLRRATVNAPFVGDFAFLGDSRLNEVSLGGQVRYILRGAFNGCAELRSIGIDPSCRLSRIDDEAFINSGLESIDITTPGVGTIGDWALAQTRLSAVNLPGGMTELGEGALAHNPLLATVTLPGMGHADEPDAPNNDTFKAPNHKRTISEVKDYTFAGDESLNPGELLREGVTNVGAFAFYNVSADIDTMRLPASLGYLGDRAMAGMTGLRAIKTAATTVPELGNEVWAGVNQPAVTLMVPDNESLALYKAADQWMYFFIQAPVTVLLGDVNGDGRIDVSDVTALISYVLGNAPDGFILEAANVNGDGNIDVSDVTALIAIVLGNATTKSVNSLRDDYNAHSTATTDCLSVPALTLRAGETRTVEVALNNDERDYTAMQFVLVLPQGLTLQGVEGVDRGARHTYHARRHELVENAYFLMGVSMDMAPFEGNEGNVLRLTLTADNDFTAQDAELLLTGILLVSPDHRSYYANEARARVNDPSGIERVAADKEVAAVRYINVAGMESDTPFDGLNIVVTTYTDGTSTVVKQNMKSTERK